MSPEVNWIITWALIGGIVLPFNCWIATQMWTIRGRTKVIEQRCDATDEVCYERGLQLHELAETSTHIREDVAFIRGKMEGD